GGARSTSADLDRVRHLVERRADLIQALADSRHSRDPGDDPEPNSAADALTRRRALLTDALDHGGPEVLHVRQHAQPHGIGGINHANPPPMSVIGRTIT